MSDSRADQARDKLANAAEQARLKVQDKKPDGFTVTIDNTPYYVTLSTGRPGGGAPEAEHYGEQAH
jgi:hypothetical protein